jgi:hypothetical protein
MNCQTRVSDTISLGGGIGSYIAYKVEVTYEGSKWAVFRRFKDFCALHERLQAHYSKDILDAADVKLPDHAIGLGKTFKFVITKRIGGLDEYLKKLMLLEDIQTHNFVTGMVVYPL